MIKKLCEDYIQTKCTTITKTPVKFQKNWHKTVRGDAHTRYLLFMGTEVCRCASTECRILCPLAFLRKGGVQKDFFLKIKNLLLKVEGNEAEIPQKYIKFIVVALVLSLLWKLSIDL